MCYIIKVFNSGMSECKLCISCRQSQNSYTQRFIIEEWKVFTVANVSYGQ